jgi:hypothetical protein
MKSEMIKEQHQDLIRRFPDASFVRKTSFKLPIQNEVFLIIKFKRYPKKPRAKLVNKKGREFRLYRISSILREWNKENPSMLSDLIKEILLIINNLESDQIIIKKDLLEGLMDICKETHPHKLVGLMGVKKGIVSEYILPSRACTDPLKDFSLWGQQSCSIPLDFSHEGTFISRPSGDLSVNEKLDIVFRRRRFTLLLAYPYNGLNCVKCFDRYGNSLKLVIEESNLIKT